MCGNKLKNKKGLTEWLVLLITRTSRVDSG